MSLNCNEINLILSELQLEGAFIQDIIQPGYDTLALYTYNNTDSGGIAKTLLVCTAQNSVRINETRRKITKNDKPLRFQEFLKAHIKGCKIISCAQVGVERVVKIELSRIVTDETRKRNESTVTIRLSGMSEAFAGGGALTSQTQEAPSEHIENYNLYIKLWNNAANVILCDENNIILEPMFRRPERKEIKDKLFEVPVSSEEKLLESKNKFPVREWIAGGVSGVSPVSTAGSISGVAPVSSAGGVTGVSPVRKGSEQRSASEGKAFPSFNSFIDNWYSEHAQNLSRESLLEKAEKWYETNHSKKMNALQNLLAKQESFKNAEQLKHQGDLILAFSYLYDNKSNYLECEDYNSGKTIRLKMNPKISVQENASEYYKNYKKAISGAEQLHQDIEIIQKQIEKLDNQYQEIKNEQNPVKIEQLLRHDSTPKQQQKKDRPGLDYTVNDWLILVGRDANENDELLRHHVRGDDLWLHVRDFPGGYVFIKARKGKTVPLDILLDAGNLAVYYSKARNAGKTDLYYTHVKYLRRAKNGPKGLVLPTQEKNLCITPDKERLSRLALLRAEAEF